MNKHHPILVTAMIIPLLFGPSKVEAFQLGREWCLRQRLGLRLRTEMSGRCFCRRRMVCKGVRREIQECPEGGNVGSSRWRSDQRPKLSGCAKSSKDDAKLISDCYEQFFLAIKENNEDKMIGLVSKEAKAMILFAAMFGLVPEKTRSIFKNHGLSFENAMKEKTPIRAIMDSDQFVELAEDVLNELLKRNSLSFTSPKPLSVEFKGVEFATASVQLDAEPGSGSLDDIFAVEEDVPAGASDSRLAQIYFRKSDGEWKVCLPEEFRDPAYRVLLSEL